MSAWRLFAAVFADFCPPGLRAACFCGRIGAGGDAMQRLYDSNMRLVGYLSSDAAGRKSVLDSDYRALGYYYPQKDKTYDKDMRLIGKGDLLTSLLGDVSAGR